MRKFSRQHLKDELGKKLVEQDKAIDIILPYLTIYYAGLSNIRRPVGCFFLLGSTGCGKTRSVEALVEVLHKDVNKLIRVDCGQYSQSHEVAKLLGSPPGYLGHRETPPFFSSRKFDEARSAECELTVVLFDEIEKAHPNLFQTILSVLDKGVLSLGDNSVASFQKSLVFFTSNLGVKEMQEVIEKKLGFSVPTSLTGDALRDKMNHIGVGATKRKFSPEFFNRLDEVITYKSLSENGIRKILKIELDKVRERLLDGNRSKLMYLLPTDEVEDFLIKKGFSELYGARELNRTIQRELVQPLAELITEEDIKEKLVLRTVLSEGKVKFEMLPWSYFALNAKEDDEQ